MATGSHEPDWQACTQNALGLAGATAAGADLTRAPARWAPAAPSAPSSSSWTPRSTPGTRRIAAGITVDDETIALDAIKQVGIGGNYLGQRHTRRHMKDVWRPRLLDRSMWDAWVASGREGAYEKATALAGGCSRARGRATRRRGRGAARIVAEAGL